MIRINPNHSNFIVARPVDFEMTYNGKDYKIPAGEVFEVPDEMADYLQDGYTKFGIVRTQEGVSEDDVIDTGIQSWIDAMKHDIEMVEEENANRKVANPNSVGIVLTKDQLEVQKQIRIVEGMRRKGASGKELLTLSVKEIRGEPKKEEPKAEEPEDKKPEETKETEKLIKKEAVPA